MKEKVKEFLKAHSDLAFVGVVLLVLILVFSLPNAGGGGKVIGANSPPPQQAAGRQQGAVQGPPQPLVNGPLKIGEYRPVEPALSGRLYQKVLEVKPSADSEWTNTASAPTAEEFAAKKNTQEAATITWPLAGRYSRVRFAVEMPRPVGNLADYGETLVEVYRDGVKVAGCRVSPSALLTSPFRVDVGTGGVQVLTLRIALLPSEAKWYGSFGSVRWNKPFTLWLVDMEFVPAGGESNGQNG